jgi:hypothetical protein
VKLYETFSEKGFHTCVVTSFGIDFDAYENMALARLRGAGCHNNVLISDSDMLGLALDGASALPRHAGRLYTVTGARARAVFHPKIVLQLGRNKGRMIVSSANMTSSGLAGNLEVAGMIESAGEDSGEARLIVAGWQFVSRFLEGGEPGVRQQVEWMRARTPWLRDVESASGAVMLADGTAATFLATGNAQGIAERFLQALGAVPVHRLIVISPYWDDDLAGLHLLQRRTGAAVTAVLIDSDRRLFPVHALKNGAISLREYKGMDEGRFVHAKILIVQTGVNDHVLYGSANCTLAALGTGNFAGTNEEACLYRVLPPGAAVEALGLEQALDSGPLDRREVKDFLVREELPLEEIARRHPGRFACTFETLSWWPPASAPEIASVEILGPDDEPIAIRQDGPGPRDDGALRYALPATPRPAFARLRYPDGGISARAIVTVLDALRDEVKDARSKRLDKTVAGLDGDAEVGLWLLESLNEIEAAEIALREGTAPAQRRTDDPVGNTDESPGEGRTLTYEQFIAGRRLRSDGHDLSRSSFAGSEIGRVHGYLNRLLAIGEAAQNHSNEGDLRIAFDMGDEVADGADALEDGFADKVAKPKAENDAQAERGRLEAARRRQNREELIEAITDLAGQVNRRAKGDGLRPIDILRLRAIVAVLAAAGWDGKSKAGVFQVLPTSEDKQGSWPRLIGRALSAYFSGMNPAIRTLRIDDYYESIPDDILVCWATCMWSIHAVMAACERHRESETMLNSVKNLRGRIYRLTGLREGELTDLRIGKVFDAMNKRFADRLGLKPAEIIARHGHMLNTLRNA